jgi:hypothetical protein
MRRQCCELEQLREEKYFSEGARALQLWKEEAGLRDPLFPGHPRASMLWSCSKWRRRVQLKECLCEAKNLTAYVVEKNSSRESGKSVYEVSHILRFLLFWNVTQCRLVFSYWRFGATFQSLLQVSGSPRLLDPWRWDLDIVQKLWSARRLYCLLTKCTIY